MSSSLNLITFRISESDYEASSKSRTVFKSDIRITFGNWHLYEKDLSKSAGFNLIIKRFYLNGRTSDIHLDNFIRRCEKRAIKFCGIDDSKQHDIREKRATVLFNAGRIDFEELRALIRKEHPFILEFRRTHREKK